MKKSKTEDITTNTARDERGLLKGIEHKFLPNGKVNWRSMVDPKWLYVNKEWFTKRSKDVPTSVEGLEDDQVRIRLAGLIELLEVRGYHSKEDRIINASSEYVAATCRIHYIGNFETEGREVVYESSADAHQGNAEGINLRCLTTCAENRAYVRAIRRFLGINIVAAEELGAPTEEPTASKPVDEHETLKGLCEELGWSLEQLVKSVNAKLDEDKQVDWAEFDQIPQRTVLSLLPKLRKIQMAKLVNA